MKEKVIVVCAVVCLTSVVRADYDCNVSLWRGESFSTLLPDEASHVSGSAPGISVVRGTLMPVRYLDNHRGLEYRTVADRAEAGSKSAGVHFATVTASPDAKPGEYRFGQLVVRVVDRVLPPAKEWKYYLDLWQHPWAIARIAKAKPFSKEHYAAMRPVYELLATAGQKTITVPILDMPWGHQCYDAYHSMVRHIRRKDGSWAFDYRVFDEYVAFGRSCGLGPTIDCFTMCPWDYAVTWEDEDGGIHKEKAVPGTKAFVAYWGDFLTDFAAHLKSKGWFEDACISMDERSPDDVQNICRLVAEKAPGLRMFLAGNRAPSQFKGIRIDHVCFGLSHLSDELIAEAASRRAQGMLTTYYVCCNPAHPNMMCHNEIEEAFWVGVYPAMVGLDGFLNWAWNSWPEDPMHDASYTGIDWGWKAGETYLAYPDASPSLRFLELRNGIVAAEKVRILKEQGLLAEDFPALAAKFDRKRAMDNKSDFYMLRLKVQELVNRAK